MVLALPKNLKTPPMNTMKATKRKVALRYEKYDVSLSANPYLNMKKTLLTLFLLCSLAVSAQELPLLPMPRETVVKKEAGFVLSPQTPIGFDPVLEQQAMYLHDLIRRSTGYDLPLKAGGKKGIVMRIDPDIGKPESYRLNIDSKRVTVTGADAAGAFYGIQTMLQLFPPTIYSHRLQPQTRWTAPAVNISDAPNRPWRGLMLDVARYFYDVDFVKRVIDLMAHYKLNKLQFHLIDDSGWRLEIKRYPLLTEEGAWAGPKENRLGGFYTQEEMKELIAYGQVRGVEIIPEIEFPAHILSAIAAYPWLSCRGERHKVPVQHFISRDLLCVGKESSFEFLQNVLDEVVALFPSPIINIGGDEAVYDRWKDCPRCKAVMEREGIRKADGLQGWLTNRVAKMMREKQRTCMGWEEIIMRGKVDEPVIAVIWHEVNDTLHATRTGHKAVLTPATHLYFDFPEHNTPGEVQAATWMPPISIEKVYSMPLNDYDETSTVLGAQACYWSDQFIHGQKLQEIGVLDEDRSERYAEYLLFPRLVALSEICWLDSGRRSWERFSRSNAYNYRRLDALDVHYRMPEPYVVKQTDNADRSTTFTLSPSMEGGDIVYTTDGSHPTRHSKRYTAPVTVEDKELFHAATINGRRVSLPIYIYPDYSAYASLGEYVAKRRTTSDNVENMAESFDLTGKIRGNGTYTLTAVAQVGAPARFERLEVWKRDQLLAAGKAHDEKFTFVIDSFEAGTPFTLKTVRRSEPNKQEFLLFLKKQ